MHVLKFTSMWEIFLICGCSNTFVFLLQKCIHIVERFLYVPFSSHVYLNAGHKTFSLSLSCNWCQTCTPLDETYFLCASLYLLHCSKLLSVFVLLSSCSLWHYVAASEVKGMCAISEIRCVCNKNYDLSSVIVLDSLLSLFEWSLFQFAMKKSWKTSYVGMRLLLCEKLSECGYMCT